MALVCWLWRRAGLSAAWAFCPTQFLQRKHRFDCPRLPQRGPTEVFGFPMPISTPRGLHPLAVRERTLHFPRCQHHKQKKPTHHLTTHHQRLTPPLLESSITQLLFFPFPSLQSSPSLNQKFPHPSDLTSTFTLLFLVCRTGCLFFPLFSSSSIFPSPVSLKLFRYYYFFFLFVLCPCPLLSNTAKPPGNIRKPARDRRAAQGTRTAS